MWFWRWFVSAYSIYAHQITLHISKTLWTKKFLLEKLQQNGNVEVTIHKTETNNITGATNRCSTELLFSAQFEMLKRTWYIGIVCVYRNCLSMVMNSKCYARLFYFFKQYLYKLYYLVMCIHLSLAYIDYI